ncbi:acyl carrier protein [Kitasatospora sp. NPDC101801]|uniref:acyl carrier protein n=1 Tax=Kitasatospora sp. NPDC101801 TaxID=3364103 RepID=UPI0038063893
MNAVYEHLTLLLTEKFEVPAPEIRPDATLTDLDLDSLAVAELFLTLQEHWSVPLEDDSTAAALTLTEVTDRITTMRLAD